MVKTFLKYEDTFREVSNVSKKNSSGWEAKKSITNVFNKVNGTWISGATETKLIYQFGGWVETIPDVPTNDLTIGGSQYVTAETCSYAAIHNKTIDVTTSSTWSISSGSNYATINPNNGTVTVLSGADESQVVIRCDYDELSATKTVYLTYLSGSTSNTETETVIDASGNTITTVITTTLNDDGSSTETSVSETVDASGNTIGSSESEINTNADGSYVGTTTNYDENGNATSGSNESGDTSGNIDTQNVAYDENGNVTVTGYTIDTTNNPDGYKDIGTEGTNTGFIPFDGSGDGFECHIRFMAKPLEQPNPPIVEDTEDKGNFYLFHLFNAMSANNPWYGFMFRWSLNKTNYSNGTLVFQAIGVNGAKSNVSLCSANTDEANEIFDFTVAYDPYLVNHAKYLTLTNNNTSTVLLSTNTTFTNNDLEFTIGYAISQAGIMYRIANIQIYDFSIEKIDNTQTSSYFCKLTLSDDSLVTIEGSGELTSAMTSSYSATCIGVSVGDLCTSIGNKAFNNFTKLTNVNIADTVTSVGDGAFANCRAIASMTLPDTVTNIGSSAFTNVKLITTFRIPNGVTGIGAATFSGCTSLTSITIPNSVTSIGASAFTNCYALQTASIPEGVTSIGAKAFNMCSGLTSIVVPNSVTSIGTDAFLSCSGATSITIGNGITDIPQGVFSRCTGMTELNIGSSVSTIGKWCFDYCTSLASVRFPSSVTSINQYAFENCSALVNIISDNTTAPSIQNNSFKGVGSDGTLTVPTGATGYDIWMQNSNYYLGVYGWTLENV